MHPVASTSATGAFTARTTTLAPSQLKPNDFSLSIYGDPAAEIDDLLPSIRDHGILVPLVVAAGPDHQGLEVISGHRRLACAYLLGLPEIPCELRDLPDGPKRCQSILEYNRQRRKTFSQLMREADAIESLWKAEARLRRLGNLRRGKSTRAPLLHTPDCRNSAHRQEFHEPKDCTIQVAKATLEGCGRTDAAIAQVLGMGGKDVYRQARIIWRLSRTGDVRAQSSVTQLDARTKTVHAAYKDLRRRAALQRRLSARRHMMCGRFVTTVLSAFPILDRSRHQLLRIRFTILHHPEVSSSIPWQVAAQLWMSVSQWDGVVLPMTFTPRVLISRSMTFGTVFLAKR